MEKLKLFYLVILLGVTSCGNKTFDNQEAMWDYLKNTKNGYLQTKTVNGIDFSLVYKPTDLLVLQELNDTNDPKIIQSLRNKYSKYLYFNLSMSKNNQELLNHFAGNKQQFGAMVNQLAFGMDQKVHAYTTKKDTIPLADYNYPRMYGMSGSTTMMFVYPRGKEIVDDEILNFTIEDLGLFTGEVKFKIPTQIIQEEPTLAFK